MCDDYNHNNYNFYYLEPFSKHGWVGSVADKIVIITYLACYAVTVAITNSMKGI